jgi:hypothetical protein
MLPAVPVCLLRKFEAGPSRLISDEPLQVRNLQPIFLRLNQTQGNITQNCGLMRSCFVMLMVIVAQAYKQGIKYSDRTKAFHASRIFL